MSFTTNIHGGGAPVLTESVYYTGTDTLLEGYALCYDFSAANVNQENAAQTSPDVGEEYWADARRILVEKPSEKNRMHFAGVVAAQSDGVVGPGWVTIHRPGSICNVYCYSDVDHEVGSPTEASGTGAGQLVNLVVDQYHMRKFGFPGSGAAIVLQDVDRSSTAGLVMCELMVGPPSGGIAYVTQTSTASGPSLSVYMSTLPAYCGAYVFGEPTLAATIYSTAMLAGDGQFIGQKVGFFNSTLLSGIVSILVSTIYKANYSTYAGAVASAVAELSAAGEFMVFQFNGVGWTVKEGHESIAS